MKKLLAIIFLSLMYSGNVNSENPPWKCEESSSIKSKCIISYDDLVLEYFGEVKNNQPNGSGKWSSRDGDFLSEGYFEDGFLKKGHSISLTVKVLKDNFRGYKVIYPDGAIFVGEVPLNSKKNMRGTLTFNNGTKFTGLLNSYMDPKPIEGTTEYLSGPERGNIFSGTYYQLKNSFIPKNGKYIFTKQNSKEVEYFKGSFKNIGVESFYNNGLLKFRNGSSYKGTFSTNNKYLNGKLYTSTGDLYKIVNNGVKTNVSQKTKSTKKYKPKKNISNEFNFMTSFALSWVFTGVLWIIIIFYFKVLGSIGKLSKKIDKKIPGTQNVAFFTGFAVTWYLAWSILAGFEIALLVNFVFIYLAVWASATVFILNLLTKSLKGKTEIYMNLFLGVCSLALAVEMIGPFIKFLKSF